MKKRRESKENSYDITIKIVTLGDSSTAKTTLTKKFCYNIFNPSERLTIGVDFHVKIIELDGRKIKLQLWGAGGGERFKFLLPTYLLGINGAILLYDNSNRATFIHLYDWIQLFREYTENISIILAGVSLGLEEDRTISSDEGLKVAKRYNLDGFIEVSPKTGKNVEELFNAIIRLALQTYSVKKKVEPKEISLHHEQKQQNIEKEDNKRLSLKKKEENKRIVLKEDDVKKRLKDLGVKLKDLDVNLEELEITWDLFLESIDQHTKVKINGNYLIPYAHYLESKLRHLYPRVYERIDDKVDINYINNLERRFLDYGKKLKEGDVKNRLKDLGVKLKDLDVNLEELEITWDSFLESIDQQTKDKIKDNYLIPYAHYLESKLRHLYPRIYKRIDDKVDINYINNLERRFLDYGKKEKNIEKKFSRKIFKVNDFLTLKLEDNRTFIYIKGRKFIQCMRLFLQIPPQARHLYEEIESIDEAAEIYKQSLWKNRIIEGPMVRPSRFQNKSITPEQEFWGHCSNIQAWVEHEYDTRLLHSNLSFPLLKVLSDAGDPKAKAIFEEEIAKRFESGYPSVVNYLLVQGYLRYIDKDRLKDLLENNVDVDCGNCGTELPDPSQKFCPNCGIPLKYMYIINSFKNQFRHVAGVVIKGKQIIYTTDNWDISRDVYNLLSTWFGQNTRFITVSGVKYSILQMEAERLVAISSKGEGSIVATKDDDYIFILQLSQ